MNDEDRVAIKALIEEATEEAVAKTLKVLGIDVEDVDHVNEFRDNQSWVKKYRKTSEAVGSRVIITVTTIATGGALAAIWAYMKSSGS